MIQTELVKGRIYRIRLTDGTWTDGEFNGVREYTRFTTRTLTHYMFENVRTGRMIEIKSRQRIREIGKSAIVEAMAHLAQFNAIADQLVFNVPMVEVNPADLIGLPIVKVSE